MSSVVCSGVVRSECRTVLVISLQEVFPLHLRMITTPEAAGSVAVAALPLSKMCDIIGGVLNTEPRFKFISLISGSLLVECPPEITGEVIKAKLETVRRVVCGGNAKTN